MALHLLHVIFGSNSLRYTEVYIACKDEVSWLQCHASALPFMEQGRFLWVLGIQ